MADLTDLQSSLPVKVSGADPATGVEDNFMEVDTSGRISVKLNDGSGTSINLGQTTMSASVPVTIASNQTALPVSQSGTWNLNNITGTISQIVSDTGTVSTVSCSTSVTTLLAANSSRKGFSISNTSGRNIYISFSSTTPTSTLFTLKMSNSDFYESSLTVIYRGIIKVITASGTGDVLVTEFT